MLSLLSNKRPFWLLLFFIFTLFSSVSFTTQRVFDDANLLEAKHKLVLERIIWEWEEKTKHQMAVVTVKSLNGSEIEDFAVKKFEELGIGNKDRSDGILFIVAPNDRRLRIEVGYGLEQYLPDGLVGEIRDTYILPHLKNNDYPSGILQGTYALLMKQAEMEGIELPKLGAGELPVAPITKVNETQGSIAGLILFILIILILIKSPTARSVLLWGLLASSLSGGRSNHSSSFGSFGGGFGGFGGGFSGGGGASGRW